MTRVKLITTSIIILIGAIASTATPAFAEFESRNETDKGTGELFQVKIAVNSSNNITCAAEEEGSTSVGWSIKAGGKEVKKASDIGFKVEKWDKCTDKVGSEKEATKISECEMEMAQPGKEAQIQGKIVKGCTIEIAESCEVKLGVQQLKVFEVDTTGGSLEGEKEKAGESTGFSAQVANMTTEVPKECVLLGIKGGKSATFEGAGVLKQVQNPAPALMFTQNMTGNFNESAASNLVSPPTLAYEFQGPSGVSSWECAKGKFTGRLAATGPSIEPTPAYEECDEVGSGNDLPARITVTNCTYEYRLVGRIVGGDYAGNALLKGNTCELKFTLTSNECEFLVQGQAPAHYPVALYNFQPGKLLVYNQRTGGFAFKTGTNVARCHGGFAASTDYPAVFYKVNYLIESVQAP